MDEKERYYSIKLRTAAKALRKNGIDAYIAKDSAEAVKKALSLIPRGASVGLGGSRTVVEIGLLNALRKGKYLLFDQYKESLSKEEAIQVRKRGIQADFFVAGSNAITEDGKIVNIDGMGNRLAAFCYGPQRVIIVAGRNKIVANIEAALWRVRNVAAPMNAMRFGLNTPCVRTGVCSDCDSPQRICNLTLIIEKQRMVGRISVILVNQDLGF